MPDGVFDPETANKQHGLRVRGWVESADGWRHPRLPALPPINLAAALELQDQADLDLRDFDPAKPPRIH